FRSPYFGEFSPNWVNIFQKYQAPTPSRPRPGPQCAFFRWVRPLKNNSTAVFLRAGAMELEKKVSPISNIICFSDSLGLWEKKISETDPSISSGSNGRSKKQPKLAP